MANIIDYIKSRGDLSIEESALNEIEGLSIYPELLKNIPIITETYKNISANDRKQINKMLKLLVITIFQTLKEEIPNCLEIVKPVKT